MLHEMTLTPLPLRSILSEFSDEKEIVKMLKEEGLNINPNGEAGDSNLI